MSGCSMQPGPPPPTAPPPPPSASAKPKAKGKAKAKRWKVELPDDTPLQLCGCDILAQLEAFLPADAHTLCALTMADIYGYRDVPGKDLARDRFVFGIASLATRCGVFSFCRHDPRFFSEVKSGLTARRTEAEQALIVYRATHTMLHEIGHAFGMLHCTNFLCLMNGHNGDDSVDPHSIFLCPCCLRKVCWTLGCRPVERYRALLRSFSERAAHVPQFAKDCVWIEARLALVQARAEGAPTAGLNEFAVAEG